MSFRRAWTRFAAAPRVLLPTPGHREAWHQGRRWYWVTVLRIDNEAVNTRVANLLGAVSDVCAPFSAATPHVTVFVHGFEKPAFEAERDVGAGRQIGLSVGGVGAFQTCVFLEVRCVELAPLRAGLGAGEQRWSHFLPHLTVGRFVHPARPVEIAHRLRSFRHLAPIPCTGTVRLMAVDAFADHGNLR